MNDLYPWAANAQKLDISIDAVRKSGQEVSEENVKAEYVRRAGLLLNVDGSKAESFAEKIPAPLVDDMAPIAEMHIAEPIEELVEEKPKKAAKKKK